MVAWDCYKAAQIFVATWTHDQDAAAAALAGKKLTDDQKKARSNFETSWRKFDADITSSLAVIEAAEGESDLVLKLRQLHASSGALYDSLVNERIELRSEGDLEGLPAALLAKKAAGEAAKGLAKRLNNLYKVIPNRK
jgi:hypothetical protein